MGQTSNRQTRTPTPPTSQGHEKGSYDLETSEETSRKSKFKSYNPFRSLRSTPKPSKPSTPQQAVDNDLPSTPSRSSSCTDVSDRTVKFPIRERRKASLRLTEVEKKELTTDTVGAITRVFCATTSMHGMNHVVYRDMRMPWRNKFYIVAVLFCCAFCIFNVTILSNDYLAHPVIIENIGEQHSWLEYPAVTLCNVNKIKKGGEFPLTVPTEEHKFGHTMDDMLIFCTFSGETCKASDFYWVWNSQLGNCYIFNNHKDLSGNIVDSKVVQLPGKLSSLTLWLNVDSDAYSNGTSRLGMIVSVHERTHHPSPLDNFVAATSGFWTSLKIVKEQIDRSAVPCLVVDESINRKLNFWADMHDYSYDRCKHTCLQVRHMIKFDCCMKKYPCNPLKNQEVFGMKLKTSIEHCSFDIPTGLNQKQYIDWMRRERDYCQALSDCEPPCNEIVYKVSPSILRWPLEHSDDGEIINKYFNRSRNNHSGHHDERHLAKDNIMAVEIFLETFDVTTYKSVRKYDTNILLSNIGGALSLGLGFSLITGVEILEYFFNIIGSLHKRCRNRRKNDIV